MCSTHALPERPTKRRRIVMASGSSQRHVANHRKFLSCQDAGILHASRNREVDGHGAEVVPLWPPRCDDDPDRLPAWSARRLGAVRPAMASGRIGRRAPSTFAGPSGGRPACIPCREMKFARCDVFSASNRLDRMSSPLSARPDGTKKLPHANLAPRRAGKDAISDLPTHAATCLRLRTCECRP